MPGSFITRWFRQLFTPHWRHPDAERRRQAISQLDINRDEDRAALEHLALDNDAGVRQAALTRLDDTEQLLALLDSFSSPELQARLTALLTGSAGNTALKNRIQLLERINDGALLNDIALQGDDTQLRLAAIARLAADDEATLIVQACDNSSFAARQAAAERVTSEAGLRQLARQARRDKQVTRLVRERLNALQASAAQQAAALAEREQVLTSLEQHGQHPWEPLYAARLRHLQRTWEALGDQPNVEQELRYQQACRQCHDTLAEHAAQQPAVKPSDRPQAPTEEPAASEEPLAPEQPVSSDKPVALGEPGTTQEQHRPAQPSPAPPEAAEAPSGTPHEAHEPVPATPKRTVDPGQFQQQLNELATLLERGAFKDASRLHQRLRQRFDHLPETAQREHQPILQRFGAQLAELRDWRGFVAGPKRDQLCREIAELADDTQLSSALIDRRHRQLVNEWKSLGDAAASRELSSQFRTCSDRIHQRLAPWHAELNIERQRNLEARQALCEQLEGLLDRPDPNADPDALREIRDRAREQWQEHFPIPREHASAMGKRFGRIRHHLQKLIDERAQDIASAKRELIESARAVLTDDQPSRQRAEQAKSLQRRWRSLGRAPKGEEQALWQEFRDVCDRIFALRDAEQKNRAQQAQHRLDAMQSLIDRLDEWQPASPDDVATLEAAISEAKTLEPLPSGRRSDGMQRRWAGIIRARQERLSRLAVSKEAARWQSLQALLDTHLSADAEALDKQMPRDVELAGPDGLSKEMHRAHQQRNAHRHNPMPASDVEAALHRWRVQLALLADQPIEPQDEPLRLAIQVERLNAGLGQGTNREQSTAEALHDVLCKLLATGPVPSALWQREGKKLSAILNRLSSAG